MGLLDFLKKGKPKHDEPKQHAGGTQNINNVTGQQQQPDTYTVKSGDSLSRIAQRYYGNANEWRKIYEANKDQIKDPDLIHPGQNLKIPKS